MNLFFKVVFFFSICLASSFSHDKNDSKLKKSFPVFSDLKNKIDHSNHLSSNFNASNDTVIYFYEEDFESGENGWSLGAGWEITSISSNSGDSSAFSSNNDSNKDGKHALISPPYSLEGPSTALGSGETMHFGFWLNADIPDADGNGDGNLEDYYTISIQDLTSFAWHSSSFNMDDGANFWCANEQISGYENEWLQYLDTPIISIGSGGLFSSRIYYNIEDDDAPFDVEGSCTNGWDAANIRISNDGGSSWMLLKDPLNPYHFDCGYGWIYNDQDYESGGALNDLAHGWSGDSGGWLDFSADLSAYAGQDVIIRFAFGSDPAYSTATDPSLTGFQVDDINISDDSGVLYSNDGSDDVSVSISGEAWVSQFYDYGACAENRPGCNGWEEYSLGLAFNGNVFMDISEYSGKVIQFRFDSIFDNNDDGGQGLGLFVDDFKIYKLSSGAYFTPSGLTGEAGSQQAMLAWDDMNASGTSDFIFDNNTFEIENNLYMTEGSGWAGQWFFVVGESVVNSVSVYSSPSNPDTSITMEAYGLFGTLFDTDPLYSTVINVDMGLNEISLDGWQMDNPFVIAYEFNDSFGAAMDVTTSSGNALYRSDGGSWYFLSGGNFGIRANITYAGANVTYNVYRDGSIVASGLSENSYTDSGLANNTTYEYTISATYSDGEESEESDVVEVTPFANSVHEESHDDGSFEGEFNAGSGNFSAVRYTAGSSGEDIVRFGWYQVGSGGAFYIKVFEDDGGMPGAETFSAVQASGNLDGWNTKDLSSEGLNVSGDFWIGTKEFSSSKPFGLDTSSDSGNSYQSVGSTGEWTAVSGNLAYHVFLDCGDNCDDDCVNQLGDMNGDGGWNVMDIVALANCVLSANCFDIEGEGCSGDMNGDGGWNVVDIVALANCVLNADCGS